MKIGISCYPTPGGSGVVATELGKALADRGHEIHFIVSDVPVRLTHLSHNLFTHKVETVSYPLFEAVPYDLALAAKMAEVADHYQLDLMHAHYAIPHAAAAYLAREMMGARAIPTVTTLHGTDITLVGMHPSLFRVTRFCIKASSAVTAVSEYLRRRTEEIFHPEREIHVIRNFVDTARFAPREETPCCDPLLVMHASNFRPVKRVETVIRVFHGIAQRTPAHLLMVGDGPDRGRAEALAEELGIAREVHFLGNQVGIDELLPEACLFLLPSEFESFGLAALEAMSSGVPVMITDRGGASEMVTHGENGFLFSPEDVDGMVEAAVALFADPERRRAMGRAARRAAVERFDTARVVPEYLALYEATLAAPRVVSI